MRVLYDHQVFSYQVYGGVSRYHCELMAAFDRAREPSFSLGVAETPNEYLARAGFFAGKRVEKQGVAGFFRAFARNELQTHLAARRREHDVFHPTFYSPSVLRNIRGAKLVVTVHDMIPETFPEMFDVTSAYGRFVTKRWIDGKRMLCERADSILAVSEQTKRDVVAFYGIDPSRVTVTYLGVDNKLTGGADRPVPDGFPARYFLYVGTRNMYKNFPLLVEACAPLVAADSSLGIVCVGGGALSADEQALLAKHGIAGRVVQRDVRDDELASCYAHALALVFPSRYEGFGIPILEAFACGTPAVLAKASCFPEIGGDAALYFDPDDAAGLREQLRRVIDDETLRASLVERGRARASAFTWEATAAKTLAAYRRVVTA